MNLPDYHFFPAPVWLLTLLHIVTLTLHFVAMNFIFGGLVVVLAGRFEDKWNNPTVKRFIALFPTIMAAAVTFGVAPLLFLQVVYPRQIYAASITSAWFWLAIIPVAILTYYFFYTAAFKHQGNGRNPIVWLGLALGGFVYISLVYSSVFLLAEHPAIYGELYAQHQNGLVLNSEIGQWLIRWSHMVLGAITVGSFFVLLLARDDAAKRTGKKFFIGSAVLAMVAGLTYLFTQGDALPILMKTPAMWVLLAAIVLTLGALHLAATNKVAIAAVLLFFSMLGMVFVRHTLRLVHLGSELDLGSVPIRPPWDVFALFLVCFVAAIGLVAWMLKLFFKQGEETA